MASVHCVGDLRNCGAVTVAAGNSNVYVGDKLWAVEGDPNSHGGGALIAGGAATVSVDNKKVIVVGDNANPDAARHADPAAASGSSSVAAGA